MTSLLRSMPIQIRLDQPHKQQFLAHSQLLIMMAPHLMRQHVLSPKLSSHTIRAQTLGATMLQIKSGLMMVLAMLKLLAYMLTLTVSMNTILTTQVELTIPNRTLSKCAGQLQIQDPSKQMAQPIQSSQEQSIGNAITMRSLLLLVDTATSLTQLVILQHSTLTHSAKHTLIAQLYTHVRFGTLQIIIGKQSLILRLQIAQHLVVQMQKQQPATLPLSHLN